MDVKAGASRRPTDSETYDNIIRQKSKIGYPYQIVENLPKTILLRTNEARQRYCQPAVGYTSRKLKMVLRQQCGRGGCAKKKQAA
jgi:hypothetical protein